MGLEIATTIEGLDSSWPLGGDPKKKGDDHLRLLKQVLKAQFPGVDTNGFKIPILSTEDELNRLVGLTSNVQGQLNVITTRLDTLEASLPAPVGTKLVFYQAAPPVGWTQDVAANDAMMRVVSTAGGGSGGSDSPILNDKTVGAHTHIGSTNNTGAHIHSLDRVWMGTGVKNFDFAASGTDYSSNVTGSAGDHDHTVSVNDPTVVGWAPKYLDMIVASKD